MILRVGDLLLHSPHLPVIPRVVWCVLGMVFWVQIPSQQVFGVLGINIHIYIYIIYIYPTLQYTIQYIH